MALLALDEVGARPGGCVGKTELVDTELVGTELVETELVDTERSRVAGVE